MFIETELPVCRALLGFLKITVQRLNRRLGFWFGVGEVKKG
jgi:hypothetical protein